MADEYISREDVLDIIEDMRNNHFILMSERVNLALLKSKVAEIPAADVQSVKHGKWETWGYIFHGIAWERCSVCGKTADISYIALLEGRIEPVTPSLCGCCGARMDGDTE